MSGTPKGKIECYHNTGNVDTNAQEMYINLYNFWKNLETAGYATEISLQWGDGGSGMDYHDGANPCGTNSFFVFKMNQAGSGRTYIEPYVTFQYTDTSNFGQVGTAGYPGWINGTIGTSGANIGFQVAWAFEADGTTAANPWAGGTAKAGADAKAIPIWAAPGGGTVHVFPRPNNHGAPYSVWKDYYASLFYVAATAQTWRVHMGADRDFFFWCADGADSNEYERNGFFGQFSPHAGITWNHPFVCYADQADLPPTPNFNYGFTTGTGDNHGAVMLPDVNDGLRAPIRFQQLANFYDTAIHPNTVVNEFDEMPLTISCHEAGYEGLCGQIGGVIFEMYDIAVHDTSVGLDRMVVSDTLALAASKLSMPWDGVTIPKSGTTRAGVDF